jgi:hypothetical protein
MAQAFQPALEPVYRLESLSHTLPSERRMVFLIVRIDESPDLGLQRHLRSSVTKTRRQHAGQFP